MSNWRDVWLPIDKDTLYRLRATDKEKNGEPYIDYAVLFLGFSPHCLKCKAEPKRQTVLLVKITLEYNNVL